MFFIILTLVMYITQNYRVRVPWIEKKSTERRRERCWRIPSLHFLQMVNPVISMKQILKHINEDKRKPECCYREIDQVGSLTYSGYYANTFIVLQK